MKSKHYKAVQLLFIAILSIGFLSILPYNYVSAANTDEKATQYCDSQNITDPDKKSICKFGFEKGYNRTTGGVCFGKVKDIMKTKYDKDIGSLAAINANPIAKALYEQCRDAKTAGSQMRGSDDSAANGQNFGDKKCGEVSTFFSYGCDGADNKSAGDKNPIFRILLTIVAWLTAGVMVAVIGGIVYGGFLYMTAQDNASQTQKGIKVIVDAVIGLIAFGLMWTILNFIIPGGIYAG